MFEINVAGVKPVYTIVTQVYIHTEEHAVPEPPSIEAPVDAPVSDLEATRQADGSDLSPDVQPDDVLVAEPRAEVRPAATGGQALPMI